MGSIILTGPKHSGKTCAGRALAQICSSDFFDLDDLIFQRTGKTPRQLFCINPDVFKEAETEAMSALVEENCDSVIAAGGGIIDNSEAITLLKKNNWIKVYLNISAGSAWNRIVKTSGFSAANAESAIALLPPFLQTENPQETHRTLHERRAAAYLQFADILIEAEGKTPEEIAMEISVQLPSGFLT